jgi:hypothetical protein
MLDIARHEKSRNRIFSFLEHIGDKLYDFLVGFHPSATLWSPCNLCLSFDEWFAYNYAQQARSNIDIHLPAQHQQQRPCDH